MSGWPYQKVNGMSALEARAVGADVAAEPKGLAGEAVPMGLLTRAAEIVPGTDHAPWGEG